MGLQQKLALKQGQSLVMTPQLSQSIKLLTLSNIELEEFVISEVERNPLLEIASPNEVADNSAMSTQGQSEPDHPAPLTDNTELETSAQNLSDNIGSSLENEFPDEQDYRNSTNTDNAISKEDLHGQTVSGGLSISSAGSSHDNDFADYTAQAETLEDHLSGQLMLSAVDQTVARITQEMIHDLDDAGYLRTDLVSLCDRLGCTMPLVEEALKLLQSFDPIGIGARNLSECLSLQLQDRNHLDPAMQKVVDNLDLLAKRDFAALGKLTGLEMDDLHDILLEIRSLDPKPGTAFEHAPLVHVVPDITVRESQAGAWAIELNNETLPKVLVNNSYAALVSKGDKDKEGKAFLDTCLQSANWLTRSLDQRAQTILKVTKEIVRQQDAFFAYGISHLRPLTLREVADAIDMHESSVSRVTTNKYVMTPRGLYELKFFFTTSIASSGDGETHSSTAVQEKIRQLVDAESHQKVLSDDALVDALKAQGIDIARRTVAKYRDLMHIPSSVQRRREKKAQVMAQSGR